VFDASCNNCWEGGTSTATAGEEGEFALSPAGQKTECKGVVSLIEKEGCEERDVTMTKALSKNAMDASLPFHGEEALVGGTSVPNESDDVNHNHAEEIDGTHGSGFGTCVLLQPNFPGRHLGIGLKQWNM